MKCPVCGNPMEKKLNKLEGVEEWICLESHSQQQLDEEWPDGKEEGKPSSASNT